MGKKIEDKTLAKFKVGEAEVCLEVEEYEYTYWALRFQQDGEEHSISLDGDEVDRLIRLKSILKSE